MPRAALVLTLLWITCLFVVRVALQWWRTGRTGLIGTTADAGAVAWCSSGITSVGLICAGTIPFAAGLGLPGSTLAFQSPGVHRIGITLALLGLGGAFWAQLAMGRSWRIGVDPNERTDLVTDGIFRWVRNPIYSGLLLYCGGMILVLPTAWAVFAAGALWLGIQLHVRYAEEPYLLRVQGEPYRRYAARVGRFVPGVGRLRD